MPEGEQLSIALGDGIYTEDGDRLGTVRGFDDSGFYVSIRGDVEAPTPTSTSATHGTGEFDLMWRCWQCGETGRIDEMPDSCPNCGTGVEDLYYWTED